MKRGRRTALQNYMVRFQGNRRRDGDGDRGKNDDLLRWMPKKWVIQADQGPRNGNSEMGRGSRGGKLKRAEWGGGIEIRRDLWLVR